MTLYGVDYSRSRPSVEALTLAGKTFACRYLAPLPNGKVIDAAELSQLHGAGIGVILNWEYSAGNMLKGRSLGVSHAQEALRQANALGAPATIPIYFSCDTDITTTVQMNAVAAYLDGASTVLGKTRVGVYGQYGVIEALVPSHATWGWQTYAWSNGRISTKAHLYQYENGATIGGADCDLDRTLKDNFGVWSTDMPITQADANLIADTLLTRDGIVPNYGSDASTNPTVTTAWGIGRAGVAVNLGYETRAWYNGFDNKTTAKLDALLAFAQAEAGEVPPTAQAIANAVLDDLNSTSLEDTANALIAILGAAKAVALAPLLAAAQTS